MNESNAKLPNFIGDEVYDSYETAQVVILPIPYEVTTTYRKGCERGPAELLDASYQLEYYDDELRCEPCFDLGIFTHPAIADTRQHPDLSPEMMLQETSSTVKKLLDDNKFVIALGGEHAITTGMVQGFLDFYDEPFTVVQIDAHADLRQTFEGSEHNHACVMRRIMDLGLPSLPVAIRCLCKEEADLIAAKNIPVVWAWDIHQNPHWIEAAIANIATEKVFLTIDLDGIDPSLIGGVGTPEPGGLDWFGTLKFLRRLFQQKTVVGCDVMELAPIAGNVVSEYTAAKLVYKLIGYWHEKNFREQW
ncbi:agmatinase [[Limnothrix rosea] IAM M-220]|uniref:agmatinase n=1 Tax=[Limnothrix rosea] IAM M-220 TaxID=454133 RepID=UPI000959EFF7|nr:agmatinase [[Limnothrix rosea] IAM M-220]OKH13432.1 agmatinase [[Limnothrix rosea] IAM M-220]